MNLETAALIGGPGSLAAAPKAPERHNWLIHRDLASEESTLEVIADDATFRTPRLDMIINQHTAEWYRSRGDENVTTAKR